MSRLRSFTTLVLLAIRSHALPFTEDEDDEECWYDEHPIGHPHPVQHVVDSGPLVHIPNSPPASILAPYEHTMPYPHPSTSQIPHATLPVHSQSHTLVTLGTVSGILFALVAFSATARYVIRRRRRLASADPFKDPPKPRASISTLLLKLKPSAPPKKRLSDESWVSPLSRSSTPSLNIAAPSLLPHDLELRNYAFPARKRKLVPVTTPECTPSDTVFGSRLDLDQAKDSSPSVQNNPIRVSPIRIPSPAYISPFSPSPSVASETSTLSPAPSTEPLPRTHGDSNDPQPGARLSRLLSSSFRGPRSRTRTDAEIPSIPSTTTTPARPTTAHLIQTARTYAHAYRPSSATTTSLYTPPSLRLAGARSRAGFYATNNGDSRATSVASATSNDNIRVPVLMTSSTDGLTSGGNNVNVPYIPYIPWRRARDTLSTVTTSDTVCTVPHLLRAASDMQISASVSSTSRFADPSPFADRPPANALGTVMTSVSVSSMGTVGSGMTWGGGGGTNTNGQGPTPVGTPLGLKLRLSDASEHEHYRTRERERQVQRQRERERERRELESFLSPGSSSGSSSSSGNRVASPSHVLEKSTPTNARVIHRRSKSLTRYRRGEKDVRRRRGEESSQGTDSTSTRIHGRTRSEPESMHVPVGHAVDGDGEAEDGITTTVNDGERRLRRRDKRRTRIVFDLRDSESVLREIGW